MERETLHLLGRNTTFPCTRKEYLEVRTFLADQLTTIEEYAKLRSAANGILEAILFVGMDIWTTGC